MRRWIRAAREGLIWEQAGTTVSSYWLAENMTAADVTGSEGESLERSRRVADVSKSLS
jgi:hypothetical protein